MNERFKFSVTQYGGKLPKSKYTWDEETKTFTSEAHYLVLDFKGIEGCTFKTGSNCTFNTGTGCTFKTGSNCTFKTGSNCTFNTGSDCTFDTCWDCTFETGSGCTFKTGWDCTFNTSWNCTFNTGSDCTFNTGSDCTFKTGSGCTFNTSWNCTFNTSWNCTFNTDNFCAVIRRDIYEIIRLVKGTIFKLCPANIRGYITKKSDEDAFYMDIEGKIVEHIIADNILSKVLNKKGNVYHVQNYGSDKKTYLIKDGDIYSHGDTLQEARESLKYKISSRDTSEFEKYTLDDELDQTTLIRAYRAITGACEAGTRYFCENNNLPKKCTIREAIEIAQGEYGNDKFKEFFERERK